MKIKEIRVEGLFDMFDHVIPLNQEERITVIYGINGVGKTVIFKMLDYLFNPNYVNLYKLSKISFKELNLLFTEDFTLKVENKQEKLNILSKYKNRDTLFNEAINIEYSNFFADSRLDFSDELGLKRIDSNNFLYVPTQEVLKNIEVFERFESFLSKNHYELILDNYPKRWEFFPNDFTPNLFFIQTQRLISFPSLYKNIDGINHRISRVVPMYTDTVTEYSQELSLEIKEKREEFDNLSEKLQLTIGERLMRKEVDVSISEEELRRISKEVEDRRNELKEAGLLSDTNILTIPDEINDVVKAVLAVNLQDMQTKLKIYDELYSKLNLFLDILNQRRLSFKKISISEKNGIVIKNDNGKILDVKDLSSGEQHEIILLYLLLFKIPENALILIDEPEISLHITWQKDFLKDLSEIIQLRKFDVIVSTHSPAIINGNWDLTVSLDHAEEQQPAE